MKTFKQLGIVALLLVAVLALSGLASAYDETIVKSIEINNRNVYESKDIRGGSEDFVIDSLKVDKGEILDIDVRIEAPADEDVENIEVSARLVHEYSDLPSTKVFDSSSLFDVDRDDTVFENVQIRVPKDTNEQTITLWVEVTGRSVNFEKPIQLHIKGKKHDLEITRLLFTPQNVVKSGSFLIGKVRLENYGDKLEDDILVRAWVEGLEGASDSDVIDKLRAGGIDEPGDSITSEELYLPIPLCATAGKYPVKVEVLYDNDRSRQAAEWEIMVEKSNSEVCTRGKTPVAPAVTVGGAGQVQTVQASGNIGIPVSVANTGSSALTYILNGDATGWGTVRYEPSNLLVVAPGQSATAFVYVDVQEEAMGTKWLSLSVRSGNDVVSQSTLQVNVDGEDNDKDGSSVRKTLEVILIVLVVLIVLLGLVVGFNRLRSDDDEEDDDSQTYY